VAASCFLSGSRDAKYVHIHVELDSPTATFPIDFTPAGAYAFGSTMPISFGGFISRWDDENKCYTGSIVPARPTPFAHSFEIKLIPPSEPKEETTSLDINYHIALVLIHIYSKKTFTDSLNKVMRGEL